MPEEIARIVWRPTDCKGMFDIGPLRKTEILYLLTKRQVLPMQGIEDRFVQACKPKYILVQTRDRLY